MWAADFSENIWDIFSFDRAVQKEIQLEHIVNRFFQVYFGKKILFRKRMFFTILLFLRIIFRDIVKLYLKIFILIFFEKKKEIILQK